MTFNASKVLLLAGVIILAITAAFAFLTDAPDVAHLVGGVALGCGIIGAGGLVA